MALLTRIFYLQIIKYNHYSALAVSQRVASVNVSNTRGTIFDRNNIPLTERESSAYAVVEKGNALSLPKASRFLADYCKTPANELLKLMEEKSISVIKLSDVPQEKMRGISVISLPERYSDNQVASHVIGYLNTADNNGVSGVEKAFNGILKAEKAKRVGFVSNVDEGAYQLFNGKSETGSIRLCIDYRLQKIAEKAADKLLKGAVVVASVKTGDILAMVSRPDFSPNNISEYINSGDGELTNRALLSYNAGSVFKIIVSAACFEENVMTNSIFNCSGSINIRDIKINCHKQEGHGLQSFSDAFANSCNPAFIEAGQKLGAEKIADMAKRFGLGNAVGIYEKSGEAKGNIPNKKSYYLAETANISIGQGEIMVTPLQVADMVLTIANNGVRKKLNLIYSITTPQKEEIRYKKEEDKRIISSLTAKRIREMMEKAAKSGTASSGYAKNGGSAGKTGSAEAGYDKYGNKIVHAWYCGYYPVENPRYVIVVFAENGKSGATVAAPVFREICENVGK